MKKRIGLVSLGCPKNLVDSEVMLGLVRRAGHLITARPSEADVLIVNTCAFVDSAKRESIDAILEMVAHKRATGGRLIVAGCLAERYREDLRREIPEIDVLLGTDAVPRIVEAVEADPDAAAQSSPARPLAFFRHGGAPGRAPARPTGETRDGAPTYLYDGETPRVLSTPAHLAYLKVAEGCDYRCAFCIIPRLRGSYRSRPADSVVAEAERFADRGVRELVLVSQDTTFYGVDRGERGALARLLPRLNRIDGLRRIRLLYLYPTTIDDGTIDAIATCDKVCKYVDLPLQHASDAVLRRMRRPGTRRSYERLIGRIRARIPGVALRTTFIVGFPGETEAEFGDLLRFVEDVGFDHAGVFTYSHEEGTAAFARADDVSAAVKRRRQRRLMTRQRRLVQTASRRRVGETVEVMVDGASAEHPLVLQGRLAEQAPDIDPVVYLDGADPTAWRGGDLVSAIITEARGYDLVARPLTGVAVV